MRIKPAIGIHAGVEHQANVVAVGENAVDKRPAQLAQLFFALRVPEKVLAVFADGNVGVHAVAVHANHRLGQERCGQSHAGGDLAADQLIELDLVGGGNDFAIAVIDFKL